ncbi:MAG: PIN domain-containing protein [Verrucomicrobia bacterium]|nr:PIN domain-containing protein [Verrucomicrobiota bacterium]
MKAFLDTSVLVPVFYGDHVHHDASLDVFTRFAKSEACCGAHSLVEVYASLTRMPGKHRISPDQAMLFIANIRERLTVVGLTPDEYADMLQAASEKRSAGGTIYDALLAACAVKSGAKRLFTWNLRHYGQFGPDVTRVLQTP